MIKTSIKITDKWDKITNNPEQFIRYYCYHKCCSMTCKNVENPNPSLKLDNKISEHCYLLQILRGLANGS